LADKYKKMAVSNRAYGSFANPYIAHKKKKIKGESLTVKAAPCYIGSFTCGLDSKCLKPLKTAKK